MELHLVEMKYRGLGARKAGELIERRQALEKLLDDCQRLETAAALDFNAPVASMGVYLSKLRALGKDISDDLKKTKILISARGK